MSGYAARRLPGATRRLAPCSLQCLRNRLAEALADLLGIGARTKFERTASFFEVRITLEQRPSGALGGAPVAVVALLLSLTVMVSCYRLEVRALQIAMGAIVVLIAQFLWLKPARVRVT